MSSHIWYVDSFMSSTGLSRQVRYYLALEAPPLDIIYCARELLLANYIGEYQYYNVLYTGTERYCSTLWYFVLAVNEKQEQH